MSIDLDWLKLDASLANHVVDLLNRQLDNTERPSFIGPVEVTSLDFGSNAPDVELIDLRDIYRDFLEDDENEDHGPVKVTEGGMNGVGLDDEEGYEWVSRRAGVRRDSTASGSGGQHHLPPHVRNNDYRNSGEYFSSSSVPSMDPWTSGLSRPPSFGGAYGLHSFGAGNDIPLYRSPSPATPFVASPSPPDGHRQSLHVDGNPASNVGAIPSPVAGPLPASQNHAPQPHSALNEPPSNPHPNLQLHFHINWHSNLRISLQTSLRINYPSPMFMSLPIRLSITGLVFNGELAVAYEGERKRVHLCILDDMDPYGPAGSRRTSMHSSLSSNGPVAAGGGTGTMLKDQSNSSTPPELDDSIVMGAAGLGLGGLIGVGNTALSPSSPKVNSTTGTSASIPVIGHQPVTHTRSTKPGLPVGQRLLPSIYIESEIGQTDKHVLKNVTRVERFIQDVVRKTVEEELHLDDAARNTGLQNHSSTLPSARHPYSKGSVDSLPSPSGPPPYSPIKSCSPQSFFSGARDFVMYNPTFITQHLNPLKNLLLPHILPGAEFDSSERDPPPRCHPGTRLSTIDLLCNWQSRKQPGERLIWLHGPAGVGKSAIMQSFAEHLASSYQLGASLFLSRPNKLNDLAKIILTLTYQLANLIPAYGNYISGVIDQDPSILNKPMERQFWQLIAEPFSEGRPCGKGTWFILIDGLDECDDVQAQRELVKMITTYSQATPTPPLLFVISSRPEYHLKSTFQRIGIKSAWSPVEILANGTEACRDVEVFLRDAFERIRLDFPDVVPDDWPSARQFLIIARAASGLFAFALTVAKYVGEGSGYGDPVAQLDTIISSLALDGAGFHNENPMDALDSLYSHILSRVPGEMAIPLQLLLGFHMLKGNTTPLPLLLVANILEMRQNVVYHSLQRLHSVLEIPHSNEAHKKALRFFHKSFADYLVDHRRSRVFFLDMDKQSIQVALCYTRKLSAVLDADNDPKAISLSWSSTAETNLSKLVFCEVKRGWFEILPRIVMKHGIPENDIGLDTLIAEVGNLRYNAFDVTDALGLINFINWIASSPSSLWKQLIVNELPWDQFRIDWIDKQRASVYYRTRPDAWGYWSANPSSLHTSKFPSVRSNLQQYFERHILSNEAFLGDLHSIGSLPWSSQTKVLMIGFRHAKRCAVVLTSIEQQETQPVARYYFPLKS
ncbi:hypothetical protein NP233_g5066 [Leucocoprinus birnbaumii]|uniref:Mitochondrial distribution and morphology protein 12 n=1 Tax=Leucocoprinus birnbaumii TaxID=56174 RepID=A0AAD5VTK9_9AGAR|nr:hypothetical protein NP233_g5066 [Leucocoprinus birnbaumii]